MRELSSLIDLQVISTTEGRKLGTVADVLVDLAAGELVCVTLARTPELQVILAEDIEVIGPDALMVSGRDRIRSREDVGDELERSRSVLGNPPAVVTNRGAQLGRLGAVHIDEGSFRVVRFEITGGPLKDLTEGVLALPVLEGTVHGEDTVIVPHDVVARRLQQAGGLRGTFRSVAQKLRGGYGDLSERSEGWLRESGDKLKEQAEHARERADELTKAAREKADKLAAEAKEAVKDAREAATKATGAEEEEEAAAAEAEAEVAEAEVAEAEVAEAEVVEAEVVEEEVVEEEVVEEEVVEEEGAEAGEETHLVPETATPLPEGAAEEEEEEEASGNEDKAEDSKDE